VVAVAEAGAAEAEAAASWRTEKTRNPTTASREVAGATEDAEVHPKPKSSTTERPTG